MSSSAADKLHLHLEAPSHIGTTTTQASLCVSGALALSRYHILSDACHNHSIPCPSILFPISLCAQTKFPIFVDSHLVHPPNKLSLRLFGRCGKISPFEFCMVNQHNSPIYASMRYPTLSAHRALSLRRVLLDPLYYAVL